MSDAQGITVDNVTADIRIANERFAQVGLRITLDGIPEVKNAPPEGSLVIPPHPDYNLPPPTNGSMRPMIFDADVNGEARAVRIGRIARPSENPPSQNPPVVLVYCKAIGASIIGDVPKGMAIFSQACPGYPELWNVVFMDPSSVASAFAAAHELGHVLTNRGHWYDDPDFYPTKVFSDQFDSPSRLQDIRLNMMRIFPNMDDNGLDSSSGDAGDSPPSKRLQFFQELLIKTHLQVH